MRLFLLMLVEFSTKTSGARSLYNTTTTMKQWRTFNALALVYWNMLRAEVLTFRVRRRNCAQLESWRCAMGLFFAWVRWHTDSHGFEGKTLVENIAQKALESIGSIKAKATIVWRKIRKSQINTYVENVIEMIHIFASLWYLWFMPCVGWACFFYLQKIVRAIVKLSLSVDDF